jgi:hypothetical protein
MVTEPREAMDMSTRNKLRNRLQMGKGRARARAHRRRGAPVQETRGQAQRLGGAARQVSEQVKDAGRNLRDAFKK